MLNPLLQVCDWLCQPENRQPWAKICDFPPFWRQSNILTRIGKARTLIQCKCEAGDLEEVFPCNGKLYIQCRHSGTLMEVSQEMCFDWRINDEALARLLAAALHCQDSEPLLLVAGRLWKLPKLKHFLGGINRDVYFAPNMAWNTGEVYAALPRNSTQAVLIYGSTRFTQSAEFPVDRCFCLLDFASIDNGEMSVDYQALSQRLGADKASADQAKPRIRRSRLELAAKVLKRLSAYHQSVTTDRWPNGMPEKAPTITSLAGELEVSTGTMSKLLSKASEYNLHLKFLWDKYGTTHAKKGSTKSDKRGKFERYNDNVGYGSLDNPEEEDEL